MLQAVLKITELLGLRLASVISELSIGFAQLAMAIDIRPVSLATTAVHVRSSCPYRGRFVLLNQGGLTSTTIADQ